MCDFDTKAIFFFFCVNLKNRCKDINPTTVSLDLKNGFF